jgi:hypothetical protein
MDRIKQAQENSDYVYGHIDITLIRYVLGTEHVKQALERSVSALSELKLTFGGSPARRD